MASDTKKAKLIQQAPGKSKAISTVAATPSSSTNLLAAIGSARQFLKEVAIEFNKITWPGRAQVIQETYSVLFLVTVITLMVLSFDWFLGKAIFGPLEYWARLHGGGVGRG
jgi:preprotein translocase SecE subunit